MKIKMKRKAPNTNIESLIPPILYQFCSSILNCTCIPFDSMGLLNCFSFSCLLLLLFLVALDFLHFSSWYLTFAC